MRAIVVINSRDVLIIAIIKSHFIKNPINGGIPAKLAMIIIIVHFFILLLISVFSVFILEIFNIYIIIATEVQ